MRYLIPAVLLLVAGVVVGWGTVVADPEADTRAGAPAGQRAGSGQHQCGPGVPAFAPDSTLSARRLIGMRVTNPIDEEIGEVADLLVDGRGRIDALVIHIGGFLGFGGRRVQVPAADVRVEALGGSDSLVAVVRATRDQFVGEAATASRSGDDD